MDKNAAVKTKRMVPIGTQKGLVRRMSGVKKMSPRTVAVTVRPVRRSKMEAEMRSVRRPTSWVEFGAWYWSLRRNVEVGLELLMWVWVGLGALVWDWRSAMFEIEREREGEGFECERERVLNKRRRWVTRVWRVLFVVTCKGTRGGSGILVCPRCGCLRSLRNWLVWGVWGTDPFFRGGFLCARIAVKSRVVNSVFLCRILQGNYFGINLLGEYFGIDLVNLEYSSIGCKTFRMFLFNIWSVFFNQKKS